MGSNSGQDIKFMNRMGLLAVRNAVNENLPLACFSYGIPADLAKKLQMLSLEQIDSIAANQQCLFTIRHSQKIWESLLGSNQSIADLSTILSGVATEECADCKCAAA